MSVERDEIYKFIENKFDIKPEFPFLKMPKYAIFRGKKSAKWFGLLMNLNGTKLGVNGEEILVLNLKCNPNFANILKDNRQIFPAYHNEQKALDKFKFKF